MFQAKSDARSGLRTPCREPLSAPARQVRAQALEEFVTGFRHQRFFANVDGAQDTQPGERDDLRWRLVERVGELLSGDNLFGWIDVGHRGGMLRVNLHVRWIAAVCSANVGRRLEKNYHH
jgi:hypothetical protein